MSYASVALVGSAPLLPQMANRMAMIFFTISKHSAMLSTGLLDTTVDPR